MKSIFSSAALRVVFARSASVSWSVSRVRDWETASRSFCGAILDVYVSMWSLGKKQDIDGMFEQTQAEKRHVLIHF